MPRLSFAVEQRILRETTLDDAPEGEAREGDGVVRLVRMGHAGGSSCSGAVIGPRQILTAQHCVVRTDAHQELTLTRMTASEVHVELGGGYLPWGRLGVHEVHVCEGYAHDLEHDVAVVVLSKPVPRDVPIFELSFEVPQQAAIYALSGFGTNAPSRVAPQWGSFIQVFRHVHRGPVLHADAEKISVEMDGAPGDSGGPIIDLATGRIAAVVSRGRTRGEQKEEPGVVQGPRLLKCKKSIEDALRVSL